MTDAIRSSGLAPASSSVQPGARRTTRSGPSFADALQQAQRSESVRFSSHAQKRLEARDIQLSANHLARLADAVERAARRGGRQSLVLMDDLAFVVNVKDRLVITAMDGDSRREGVFTQIDSVVLAREK